MRLDNVMMREKVEAMKTEIGRLKQMYKDACCRRDDATRKNRILEMKCLQYEDRMDMMNEVIDRGKNVSSERVDDHKVGESDMVVYSESEYEKLKEKHDSLYSEYAGLRSICGDMGRRVEEGEREVMELEEKVRERERALRDLGRKLEEEEREVEVCREMVRDRGEEVERLEKRVKVLEERNERMEKELGIRCNEKENEVKELNRTIGEVRSELEREKEAREKERKLSVLKNDQLEKKLSEVFEANGLCEKVIKDMKSDLRQYEADNDELISILKVANDEINYYKSSSNELEASKKSLETLQDECRVRRFS